MTWLPRTADGDTNLERVLRLVPAAYDAVREQHSLFWAEPLVDARLLELMRLRISSLLGDAAGLATRYEPAVAAGVSEEVIADLPAWPTSPRFSEFERQVLNVTEQYLMDAHGISDADIEPIRSKLGEPGMVALLQSIAVFEQLARLRLALATGPDKGRSTVPMPSATSPLY